MLSNCLSSAAPSADTGVSTPDSEELTRAPRRIEPFRRPVMLWQKSHVSTQQRAAGQGKKYPRSSSDDASCWRVEIRLMPQMLGQKRTLRGGQSMEGGVIPATLRVAFDDRAPLPCFGRDLRLPPAFGLRLGNSRSDFSIGVVLGSPSNLVTNSLSRLLPMEERASSTSDASDFRGEAASCAWGEPRENCPRPLLSFSGLHIDGSRRASVNAKYAPRSPMALLGWARRPGEAMEPSEPFLALVEALERSS
eukprot:2756398-Rhodomonas_salina.1